MRLRIVFLLSFMIAAGVLTAAFLPPANDAPLASYAPVPPPAQPLALAQPVTGCVYRVQFGDNLFRIAMRYGVSYTYLATLNGIPNPNLIYAGSLLNVPCGPGAPPPVTPANCAPSQTYTVQPGDNRWRIAYNFKTSLALLQATNNLYGRVLRPGTQLTIPCPGSVQYKEVPPPNGQPQPTSQPTTQPPGTQTPPPGPQVLIQNGRFNPPSIVVAPGTTVNWLNKDSTPYTIVSPNGGPLNSPSIPPGGYWWFTFPNVGSFDYQLQSNPSATGNVNVKLP